MILATAPEAYSRKDQSDVRTALQQADAQNLKGNKDLIFAATKVTFRANKIILTSPNGTEYYLTVSNVGVLGTTAV